MSVERVREIQRMAQEPASLESPVGEEEDSSLGDFVADERRSPGKPQTAHGGTADQSGSQEPDPS